MTKAEVGVGVLLALLLIQLAAAQHCSPVSVECSCNAQETTEQLKEELKEIHKEIAHVSRSLQYCLSSVLGTNEHYDDKGTEFS